MRPLSYIVCYADTLAAVHPDQLLAWLYSRVAIANLNDLVELLNVSLTG